MSHLKKLGAPSILKWLSSRFSEAHHRSPRCLYSYFCASGLLHPAPNPRCYGSLALLSETHLILNKNPASNVKKLPRMSPSRRIAAQVALFEYLHETRSLEFPDAEYISMNSPTYIKKLLTNVELGEDVGRSLTRLFSRSPINEYEPFFESLGLKPSEMASILPCHAIFLSDNEMLLENYYVLCNYGIARDKIGKIYKEAMEVFRYDYGVLDSKLRALEEAGLSQSTVIEVVASRPDVLVDSVNVVFVKLLEELKSFGIHYNWIKGCLSEKNSYNWNQILRLLVLFNEMGYSKEQLAELLKRNPELSFEVSGNEAFCVTGLLLKLGFTIQEKKSLFLQFPQLPRGSFLRNFRQGLLFLIDIEMEPEEIRRIVYAHSLMLGSHCLKKSSSVVSRLNTTKKRLCGIIKKDPLQLKNYVLGNRVDPLPNSGEADKSLMQKTEFLMNLGFIKNSDEMRKALKVFRGKGGELQERLHCLVKSGLDKKDVFKMVKEAPQILNQTRDIIEMKIEFLKNGLGYPISSLVSFPACISYSIERLKLRSSMYDWLKDEGAVASMMSLVTIHATSEKKFLKMFVNRHPRGPEVWDKLKATLLSS